MHNQHKKSVKAEGTRKKFEGELSGYFDWLDLLDYARDRHAHHRQAQCKQAPPYDYRIPACAGMTGGAGRRGLLVFSGCFFFRGFFNLGGWFSFWGCFGFRS
jgi:hypothetical protein